MKTSVKWFEGVKTEEEKKEVYAVLLSARPAFERLAKLIEKEKLSGKNYRAKKEHYDSAAWPYLQADGIGEERAYNNILKLLSIRFEESK